MPAKTSCARRRTYKIARASLGAFTWLGCATPPESSASPWTRPPGDVFIETRLDYFDADLAQDGAFQRLDNILYTEIGVGRRLAVGAKIAYGQTWLSADGAQSSAAGFSEIEAFAQRTVFSRGAGATSARLAVTRPARLADGARGGLAADGVDVEFRALHGRTLTTDPIKIFATAEAGYRARLGDAADQARFDASIGLEPTARWLLLLDAQSTLSLRNENPGGPDFDVVRIQPSLVWRVARRWSLRAGAAFETATRNLAPGRTIFVGIWTEF